LPQVPFGGVKQSGYGRECGYEGLRGYLHAKSILINMNLPAKPAPTNR
jgi:acyl-CoA reductase-like NAD-dependent aldehyde dehydrogenase